MTERLPDDKVILQKGKVVLIEEWCDVYGQFTNTTLIIRDADGKFHCTVRDTEHGGSDSASGSTLEEAIAGKFNPEDAAKFVSAFIMANPTIPRIKAIFPRHQIVIET